MSHYHHTMRVLCEMQDEAAAYSRWVEVVADVVMALIDFRDEAEDGDGPHTLTIEVEAPGFGRFPWEIIHRSSTPT